VTRTQPDEARHPAMLAVAEQRSADLQLRIADAITAFAGSMKFVYLHAVLFAVWMLVFENSPWPTLTLIVSLEAIFLSTFVMIGQNRQAAYQQAKADHDFLTGEQELHLNTELTKLIHQLTTEIHTQLLSQPAPGRPPRCPRAGHLTTQIAVSCAPDCSATDAASANCDECPVSHPGLSLEPSRRQVVGSGHEPRK
jgi:hypothetical protein